ncbi:MAG: M24 family metallopeptidase [Actinomycetota bacterium]
MSVFADRRERVHQRLGEDVEALFVTAPVNVRYLTGFTGSNGQLLLDAKPIFFTDGRYDEQSTTQVPDLERLIYAGDRKMTDLLGPVLADRGTRRLGVEAAHTTLSSFEKWHAALSDIELVHVSEAVEAVRARKDEVEIAAIRRAQGIAEAAVSSVLLAWENGTEADLALALELEMRTGGAEGVAFEVIVATGPHSALPHASPRRERADLDEILLIDIGAKADGYCSDMTRTYLGPHAPEALSGAHDAVLRALEAGCAAVRPGKRTSDVDRAAREVLEKEGLGDRFVHSTGHGVGLDIHESPSLTISAEDVLEPGMVVTIEPGVYLPGVGGVRVEDLLVVTQDGAENLTTLDRGSKFREAGWS